MTKNISMILEKEPRTYEDVEECYYFWWKIEKAKRFT